VLAAPSTRRDSRRLQFVSGVLDRAIGTASGFDRFPAIAIGVVLIFEPRVGLRAIEGLEHPAVLIVGGAGGDGRLAGADGGVDYLLELALTALIFSISFSSCTEYLVQLFSSLAIEPK